MIRRRPLLPPDVKRRLDLEPDDVVLGSARTTHGWAVITRHGLRVVGGDEEPILRREWHEVDRATGAADDLQITWVDGTRSRIPLVKPSKEFPNLFRSCVVHSIVHTEPVEGTSDRARVVVRRGLGDELFAQVIADGIDPGEYEKAIDAAVARAGDAVGRSF